MPETQIPRDEVASALGARRELGAELEPELADSFAASVERAIDARVDARLAERRARRATYHDDHTQFVLALVSLAAGIPITGVAGHQGGIVGILIAWLGIAVINVAHAIAAGRGDWLAQARRDRGLAPGRRRHLVALAQAALDPAEAHALLAAARAARAIVGLVERVAERDLALQLAGDAHLGARRGRVRPRVALADEEERPPPGLVRAHEHAQDVIGAVVRQPLGIEAEAADLRDGRPPQLALLAW